MFVPVIEKQTTRNMRLLVWFCFVECGNVRVPCAGNARALTACKLGVWEGPLRHLTKEHGENPVLSELRQGIEHGKAFQGRRRTERDANSFRALISGNSGPIQACVMTKHRKHNEQPANRENDDLYHSRTVRARAVITCCHRPPRSEPLRS